MWNRVWGSAFCFALLSFACGKSERGAPDEAANSAGSNAGGLARAGSSGSGGGAYASVGTSGNGPTTSGSAGMGNGGMTTASGGSPAGTGGGDSGGTGPGGAADGGAETGSDGILLTLRLDDACGSLLGGNVCLHEGKASDDGTPFSKSVTATLNGTAGTMYQVKIRVRGVVELTQIIGGTLGIPVQFVTGGNRFPSGSNEAHNQYWRISTSIPAASYFLNATPEGTSHLIRVIDYDETIPIGGGATVTLELYDDNAHSVSNTETNPPLSIAGIPGSMMSGQFVQIDQAM